MPITKESFEPRHFEPLIRGLGVAYEAYEDLIKRYGELRDKTEELEQRITGLEVELEEAQSSSKDFDRLAEAVADAERGVVSVEEVFACVRGGR